MNAVLEEMGKIGIVPVIKIDDAEKAVPLAEALLAGGIPCVELTFRTAQGEEAIKRIAKAMPKMLIGAGTVLTTGQVDRAIDAGAKFIVTPGFNPKVVAYCIEKGISVTPGCSNPSDVEQAIEFGLDVVKFFPAEQSGGIDYIKALSAPYPNMRFIPTGGINAGAFDKITSLSKEAALNLLGLCFAHIGINSGNEAEAMKAAKLINLVFGFVISEGNTSIYASDYIELVKTASPGTRGHIAIGTNSIKRALAHLDRLGIAYDYENAKKDSGGRVLAVYLKDEILGFALHLVQKQ